jgi:hypothetical protein
MIDPGKLVVHRVLCWRPGGLFNEEGHDMKLFFGSILLLAMTGLSGCVTLDTPAYSAKERFAQIGRNWHSESEMFNDDLDSFLLLRPSSQLSSWNVYHRD